jgi:thiol-disulfide isomerase/thioredoxin
MEVIRRMRFTILVIAIGAAVAFWLFRKYRVAPSLDVEHLSLTTLDGVRFDATELRGKTLFVNYWATWCGQCLNEMPSIEEAYNQTDHDKVVFLMITDDSPEKVKKFLDRNPYPMKFVCLNQRLQEIGINTIPTSYIYDDEGYELFTHVGELDWSDAGIVQLLSRQ